MDTASRCYRYTMESTGLPVADYVAEFRIDPMGSSLCTVRWSAGVTVTSSDEEHGIQTVEGFLSAGIDELQRQYG